MKKGKRSSRGRKSDAYLRRTGVERADDLVEQSDVELSREV
jgi:hypothetical protein